MIGRLIFVFVEGVLEIVLMFCFFFQVFLSFFFGGGVYGMNGFMRSGGFILRAPVPEPRKGEEKTIRKRRMGRPDGTADRRIDGMGGEKGKPKKCVFGFFLFFSTKRPFLVVFVVSFFLVCGIGMGYICDVQLVYRVRASFLREAYFGPRASAASGGLDEPLSYPNPSYGDQGEEGWGERSYCGCLLSFFLQSWGHFLGCFGCSYCGWLRKGRKGHPLGGVLPPKNGAQGTLLCARAMSLGF